ncbi:hypothetical protein PBY51_019753 [Eleginops maclovinus]|nr:hypothetical protein PBY51_019753 [Eleginops maclovinus]
MSEVSIAESESESVSLFTSLWHLSHCPSPCPGLRVCVFVSGFLVRVRVRVSVSVSPCLTRSPSLPCPCLSDRLRVYGSGSPCESVSQLVDWSKCVSESL